MDTLTRRSRRVMGAAAFWRGVVSIMIPSTALTLALFIDLDAASASATFTTSAATTTTTKFEATSIAYINSSSYIHDITTSDVSFGDSLNTPSTRRSLREVGSTKYTHRAARDEKQSSMEEVQWEEITSRNHNPDSCPTIFSDILQLEKCVCPDTSLGTEVNCDNVGDMSWTFVLPKEITTLSASRSNLLSIPELTESAKNIVSLNLSDNSITQVDDKLLIFPHVQIIDLSLNNLRVLNLSEIELPYLTIVNASNNKLQHFSSKPYRIATLNLSSNNLTNTTFISNLILLKYVDLSRNLISVIETDTFKSLIRLQYLDLSHNRIQETSFIPKLSETTNVINLSNNSIKHIYARDLNSLQELNLGSNAISEIRFSDLPKTLDTLKLSNNYISSISEISVINSQIVYLFIANNSLSNVNFIKYMTNLKTIDLSFNDLRNIDDVVFRNNKLDLQLNRTNLNSISFTLNCDVRILNIENNNIMCLPPDFFKINLNLREMYILNNPLQELQCPLSPENKKLLEYCDSTSNFRQEEKYVVIDMKHNLINKFLNCMLQIRRNRGKNFLKMCHQEHCSSNAKNYVSFHLLIVTYFLLTFL